jgi:hypothetical protein
VKDTQTQLALPGVPRAKQGREVPPRWEWTEASVWTERMLATLERGIKGGKWFRLIDKVWSTENLQSAVRKVARGKSAKKPDGRKCRRYLEQSSWRLPRLQETLKRGDYQPQPAQRVWIPKLGSKELRPLGIPPVENRVVEMAIRNVIEPIFEHDFAEHSYGFRPGRGAKDALRRVQQLLRGGTDAAPDQNPHRGRQPEGRLRFSGLSFRARLPMAAPEEPGEVSRSHPGQDPQTAQREHE